MYYADIKNYDVANGPGVRVSLFVSGCTHHCKGCFNEAAWDFKYGNKFTDLQKNIILKQLENDFISGITILGGEPFEFINQEGILPLLEEVKKKFPNKSIWVYTGYLFDKDIVQEMAKKNDVTKQLLEIVDVIVDGKFELDKKNLRLKFRGSSNQRIIDVKSSFNSGKVILMEEFMK